MTSEYCNPKSFDPLFDRHYNELVNFTTFLIKDRPVAETLVINLFTKIWVHYKERFCTFENIRSYLFCASYHEVKKFLTEGVMEEEYRTVMNVATSNLNDLIKNFPRDLQQIIRFLHIENLTPDQITDRLNMSLVDFKRLKQQAEYMLAESLHQKK